jgi:hypothetical protein
VLRGPSQKKKDTLYIAVVLWISQFSVVCDRSHHHHHHHHHHLSGALAQQLNTSPTREPVQSSPDRFTVI